MTTFAEDSIAHGFCDLLLKLREDVLNVLDTSRLRDHRARLEAANIPLDDGVGLASSEDTYLAGGEFDMDRMVAFVRVHLERAMQEAATLMHAWSGHCRRE